MMFVNKGKNSFTNSKHMVFVNNYWDSTHNTHVCLNWNVRFHKNYFDLFLFYGSVMTTASSQLTKILNYCIKDFYVYLRLNHALIMSHGGLILTFFCSWDIREWCVKYISIFKIILHIYLQHLCSLSWW